VTPCDGQTDEEIMARVPDDREVFSCLIERYEQKLRRYLKRLMPGLGDELDDVLQEVFIKAYVNAHGFDPMMKFSSWIYRITHNEAVSWLRKKSVRPDTIELGDDDFQTFTTSVKEDSDERERVLVKDEVARTLTRMPEKYRTVLVLKFLEGKSYEEIGDILAVPGGTVATLIHRAKKHFINVHDSDHA
jgi:RNA polymerase sigma-70 factor (ECF subfamily)